MKYSFSFAIPAILAISLFGCGQDGLGTDDPEPHRYEGENYTLFISEALFQNLLENRSEEISESLEIIDVRRNKENGTHYLEIEIAHQSCDPEPSIVWDGAVADSYPPQVFIFVQLDPKESGCTDDVSSEVQKLVLSLNLNEMLQDEFTIEKAIFRVSNASRDNEENDYMDEPVSSGNKSQ